MPEVVSALPDAAVGRLAPAPVALTRMAFATATAAMTGHDALMPKI
jgi:hypothetical protein